ncbi:hypothetical protein BC835DRAFT_1204371, partial [Cytidiella melzeri]
NIKPHNFVVAGNSCNQTVYIINFRLAALLQPQYAAIYPFHAEQLSFWVSSISSINVYNRVPYSQHNDMELLAYVLIKLAREWLPWQELSGSIPIECSPIHSPKRLWSMQDLCTGIPEAFAKFLHYAQSFKFNKQPFYYYACLLFHTLML